MAVSQSATVIPRFRAPGRILIQTVLGGRLFEGITVEHQNILCQLFYIKKT